MAPRFMVRRCCHYHRHSAIRLIVRRCCQRLSHLQRQSGAQQHQESGDGHAHHSLSYSDWQQQVHMQGLYDGEEIDGGVCSCGTKLV